MRSTRTTCCGSTMTCGCIPMRCSGSCQPRNPTAASGPPRRGGLRSRDRRDDLRRVAATGLASDAVCGGSTAGCPGHCGCGARQRPPGTAGDLPAFRRRRWGFAHAYADIDYSLRLRQAGGENVLVAGHVGTCARDDGADISLDPVLPFSARWRYFHSRKGTPLGSQVHYLRRHGGPFWPFFCCRRMSVSGVSPSPAPRDAVTRGTARSLS